MSSKHHRDLSEQKDLSGGVRVERREPVGRAGLDAHTARRERREGGLDGPPELPAAAVEDALARSSVPAAIRDQLPDGALDELVRAARAEGREIVGTDSLLTDLAGRLLEAAMRTELTEHLGYEPHQEPPGGTGNTRNGTTPKTVLTEHGPVRLNVPRDRQGSFEPKAVPKGARRVEGLDEQILALYGGGMTVREIEAFLARMYGPGVKRDTISRVTQAVLSDAQEWQTRPLEEVYAVLLLDALVVKIRDGQAVRHFACYLAVGVTLDGERDVLGMWFERTEGAKFWLQVLTELSQRGIRDVLVCCVDGLAGFPEAIEAVFPNAWVQTCVVHKIRSSLRFVSYQDRRHVAADLKRIYTAVDRDHAWRELERFAEKWDQRYPTISAGWVEDFERIVPFLAFPPDLRRIVYTTNAIEALNRQIRKIIKTRGSFPTEDSARKLIYLAITGAQTSWRSVYNWNAALNALRIHFPDRVPAGI